MNYRLITGLALTGAAVLVSCSQDQPSSRLLPTQASRSVAAAPCAYVAPKSGAIFAAAQAYFAPGDPVYALLPTLEQAYNSGGAAGATSAGFDVLARLGAAADGVAPAAVGTPAQGSTFANAVLACMSVTGHPPAIDFAPALGPSGLFAVRDGSGNAPVISRLVVSGAPAFGAEPSTGNWPLAAKTLFYGVKLTVPTLASETPAGAVFELTTLPSGLTFNPEIRTGVCDLSDPNAQILHAHQGDPAVILPPAGLPSFCPASTGARQSTSSFMLAARQVVDWLAPRQANAANFAPALDGGGGGLVSGLSQIGPVSFTSTVAWVVTPKNTSRSTRPQFRPIVTVRNVSANGNPIQGSLITIVVSTNNGSFNISGNTARTNAAGIAVFPNLTIDKPGGYLPTAVSEVGGSATAAKFNINGQ